MRDMKKVKGILRKLVLLGLGTTLAAKKEGTRLAQQLMKEYNINEKEANKVVTEVMGDSAKARKQLEGRLEREVDKTLSKAGLERKKAVKKKAKKKKR